MQMIDVLKRLAELDAGNPNIINPMTPTVATKPVKITEGKKTDTDLDISSLRTLSGVKKLTESKITECGMSPMGAPMPPMFPASINMSAGNAGEIVSMMRGIMDLANTDVPSQTAMPTMGSPMPSMDVPMGGDHDEPDMDDGDHGLEMPDAGPLGGDEPGVTGPTFGDDAGGVDDSGSDELADMIKKIKTGEPVKISTDMPVKVTSDEPIKGTTDKLNKVSDDGQEDESARMYNNSGKKPTDVPKFDPNNMAHMINKVDQASIPPGQPGDNKLPSTDEKKEESVDLLTTFEAKLFAEYKKFVKESKK
jgi:hypothetical protein